MNSPSEQRKPLGKIMRTGEGSTTFGLLVPEYKISKTSLEEGVLNSNQCSVPSPDNTVAADTPSSKAHQ